VVRPEPPGKGGRPVSGDGPETIIVEGRDLEVPLVSPFGEGEVGVFSTRAPGKVTANEDSALVVRLPDGRGVLAVADGLGGLPSGDEASALCVRRLAEAVAAPREESDLRSAILHGFDQANHAVTEHAPGSGSTLAVVEIVGEGVRPYHAGDSEILVVGQRGRLKLQTVSHSPVGYALQAGLVDEEEALHHEDRHLISNIVGSAHMRVEMGWLLRLCSRDTVLVASDGLFDNLTLPEIFETVRRGPLARVLAELVAACRVRMVEHEAGRPSKPDDLTVVAYRPTAQGRRRRRTLRRREAGHAPSPEAGARASGGPLRSGA